MPWLLVLVWFFISPWWIQRESLWIDEAGSAVKTLASTPSGVWQELWAEKNSNLHLPIYHYYLWASSKILGHSEAALRWGNVPWILIGFTFMLLGAGRAEIGPAQTTWLALFLVTNPFIFYYTNEVRPYAMQFGLAAAAFTGMMRILAGDRHSGWAWSMAWGTVLLAWTTIYGLAYWLINLFWWFCRPRPKEQGVDRPRFPAFLFWGGASALGFHAWVVIQGASASPVGKTGWASLAYAVCEWTGATGFLPGRADLRSGLLPAWPGFLLPAFTVFLCLTLFFLGWRHAPKSAAGALLPAAWFLPGLGIVISGVWKKFRVLGRHFTPVSPAFFWFLSFCPASPPQQLWTRCAGITLLALWVWSDVRLATLPEHRKDDYRAAAHFIRQNRLAGETVWWAADDAGARFYGLTDYKQMANAGNADLSAASRPDWIVLSKTDVYDGRGALREYIGENGGQRAAGFQSFLIYRFPAAPPP